MGDEGEAYCRIIDKYLENNKKIAIEKSNRSNDIKDYSRSNFIREYNNTFLPELLERDAMKNHIKTIICGGSSEIVSTKETDFVNGLDEEAFSFLETGAKNLDVMKYCLSLWTSKITLHDREFCSILNEAIRNDISGCMTSVALISRALNKFCVTRPKNSKLSQINIQWPSNTVGLGFESRSLTLFRGCGISRTNILNFFKEGLVYRTSMFLATSSNRYAALDFCEQATNGDKEAVLFEIELDPKPPHCVHVNYITNNHTTSPGEHEFLFSPYSVFTVLKCELKGGTIQFPHIIRLKAAKDNLQFLDPLPCSSWH
eukprot:TRINITY_DN2294_c0_g1_i12.p1 TRINITY_DN2294_c0_g1~~TRINITY_DN2294_c0_g1_i12.p1  ORF type:complete len:315 (+),score=54.77 TRINITY_DN2294_c0_g1_i12:1857-2801(+)